MSEADEQVAVVDYCRWKHIPVFHIPNEGKRSYSSARNLQAQGMSKGVPDLMIPVPRGTYHGMFIEMKRIDGGRLSEAQKEWMITLNQQGYFTALCHGAESAISEIERYMRY